MLDSDDEDKRRKGLDIYESLFRDIFEGDNLLWNQDLITEYIGILIKY